MTSRHRTPLTASLAALVLAQLAPSPITAAQGSDPATLPLLGDDDLHLYVQEAYEVFDAPISTAVAGRYAELVDAGMDTARHLFDWADLEIAPGVFDPQVAIEAMDARTALGIEHQFCNLVTVDSGGPVVPDYVQALLDNGVAWDDPRILEPFLELLDVFVPLMLERDLFMLGFANEPGGYYEDDPAGAASFGEFVRRAAERAALLAPQVPATVVFAGTEDAGLPSLMPWCDVASFNTREMACSMV